MNQKTTSQSGFSLVELMVAAVVFTLLTGVMFSVLVASQQRYKIESEVLNSFTGANVAMDQITRDIHQTGYPPANTYTAATAAISPQLFALPFAWDPGYPNLPSCTIGGTCAPTPSAYDIIVETVPDPTVSTTVQWIRYQLPAGRHTLLRAAVNKFAGGDPVVQTAAALTPYLNGVMNNATAPEIASMQQSYPNMFPGNADVPMFTYYCDSAAGPIPCTAANTIVNIREVQISLIVKSSAVDPKTMQPRIVTLTGQAMRLNPNQ